MNAPNFKSTGSTRLDRRAVLRRRQKVRSLQPGIPNSEGELVQFGHEYGRHVVNLASTYQE